LNILFLVPYVPTLIRTRSYNLIRFLARSGHSVTLATLWEKEAECHELNNLVCMGIRVISVPLTKGRSALNMLRALVAGTPLQASYCWQPALAQQIGERLATGSSPYDIIHVEHLRGARYGLHIQSAIRPQQSKIPVVWDSVDCISLLFEQAGRNSRSRFGRWISRFELERTRRYEAWLLDQFDQVLVTSPVDRAALEQLHALRLTQYSPRSTSNVPPHITVLSHGVDLTYFTPNYGSRFPDTILLTGKMSYHANVTAALYLVTDIMPRVWALKPEVKVAIVGSMPPREVKELAQRHAPRVTVTGYVPDIRPHLWSATVAVAPVPYGAGIQIKVLEAMACAAPVVATPSAVSALTARAGEDFLVAGTPEDFAAALLRLLDDNTFCARLGAQGRRYVAEHHDWNSIGRQLEEIYVGLTCTTH